MKKFTVLDAKRIFYEILDGRIETRRGIEKLSSIKSKNKVLKGYIFGVISILNKKARKYSFDINSSDKTTIRKLKEIVTDLGDNRFLSDFEKGYFLSWKDYINYILKISKEEGK